ncbi:hypothetical protein K438DRAFT_1751507 [Mycena galopus ATCC 62051]|nr:hypothetical protein K438DRAFT_1751507 [Mycena galopus ATCC 62051]
MAAFQGYAGNVKSEKDRPGGESEVDSTCRKFAGTMSAIVHRVRHGKPELERTGEFGFGSDQGQDKLDMPDKPDELGVPEKPDEPGVLEKPDEPDVITYLGYCIQSPVWNARSWPEWKRIKAGGERRWTDDSGVPIGCWKAMLVQYYPELGSPSDIEPEVGTICRKSRNGVVWGISAVSSASDESAKVFGNERKMTSVSPL